MAKMTPEQEASYALDFGVARSDLPPDAQLAYDRLVAQRARASATAPVSRATLGPPVALPSCRDGLLPVGTALVFLAGQGGGVVLLPYAFTRWQPGTPPWPVAVRAIGVDTHTDTHAACLLDALGRQIAVITIPADPGGCRMLLAWARRNAPGPRLAWAVEGTRVGGARPACRPQPRDRRRSARVFRHASGAAVALSASAHDCPARGCRV